MLGIFWKVAQHLKNVGHHGCSKKKVLGYTWILLCETRIDLKNIYPKKLLEHAINLGNLGNIMSLKHLLRFLYYSMGNINIGKKTDGKTLKIN